MGVIVTFFIIIIALTLAYLSLESSRDRQSSRERELRADLYAADAAMDRDHRETKMRMNELSGNAWRNVAE